MSKAISSYLVALILVIVVLVIVSYLLFTYYGGFNATGKYADCTSKKLLFCSDWEQNGRPPSNSWDNYAPGCSNVGVRITSEADCK